ncbi:MAG: 16S rRNA (uracil(1498)-N(3))-methyltransferase [Bacteroidetes bacterium]|nr:16S rRNA (uracil(1498)-N(3))-methyltransferase [Bacteroidota bacterium]MBS1943939.1 16S rRNA (uracil(1498)-N(3))-methyltransferase [Bacteroidota bacterium]
MHLFHCADLGPALVEVPDEEAHHAMNVLRLSPGAAIGLLDGRGGYAEAVLQEATKRKCVARILRRETAAPERKARIHLAVAPTKQMERFEWFLEKATEIGVDRITPLMTHRTERGKLRHDRLERVLVGAMKQSQRRWLPQLDGLTGLADLVKVAAPQRLFGWCEGEHRALAATYRPDQDALLLIGPEGDFTAEEADLLFAHGFAAISLGNARLRTETAAIAACTWMNFAQLAE